MVSDGPEGLCELRNDCTLSLGVKVRLMPALVMVTVRMQPPEEPSGATPCQLWHGTQHGENAWFQTDQKACVS